MLRERKTDGIRGGDLAPVMDGSGTRVEYHLPPCFPAAPAPIHIIAVHEHPSSNSPTASKVSRRIKEKHPTRTSTFNVRSWGKYHMCSPAKKREFLNLVAKPVAPNKSCSTGSEIGGTCSASTCRVRKRGDRHFLPWDSGQENPPRHPDSPEKRLRQGSPGRYSAPGIAGSPGCCPWQIPGSRGLLMSLTQGNRVSIISAEPSLEALSTTRVSMLRRGGAPSRLSRHNSK